MNTAESTEAWEREGPEGNILRRQLAHGQARVFLRQVDGWFVWRVDGLGLHAEAQGKETTVSRAKYRAMLVYLAMTREAMAT